MTLRSPRIAPFLLFLTCIFVVMSGPVARAQTAPVAVPDTFLVSPGALLEVAGPGVMENDDRAGNDSLQVRLLQGPRHGAASMGKDGSFWYTPNQGFAGLDSMVYVVDSVPVTTLVLDSTRSSIRLTADLSIPNLGTGRDDAAMGLSGHLWAILWPQEAPFDSVSFVGLHITNVDSAALDFDYGDFGAVVLTVNLDARPRSIRLGLKTPGPTAPIGFAGLFNQQDNLLTVSGDVDIKGSGILGGLVPSGPMVFDTETRAPLSGIVSGSGSAAELILDIALNQEVELGDNTAVIDITGEAIASGTAVPARSSQPTVVYIRVESLVAVEEWGGQSDLPDSREILAYPNPATDHLDLRWTSGHTRSVRLVDLLGRTVIAARDVVGGATLDISGLAPGAYFLIADTTGGGPAVQPILVAR